MLNIFKFSWSCIFSVPNNMIKCWKKIPCFLSQDNCLIPKDRHKYYWAGEPRNGWALKRRDTESWYFMLLLLSHYAKLIATSWTASHQAFSSFTTSRSLPKLRSIESVIPSNHLILCCPLLLLPPIFSQNQGLFQWVMYLHQMTKILELQLQHQSFQWIFRVDLP